MSTHKIVYTLTDEAPALATASLLPVIQAFARQAGVAVEARDISVASRILAAFPECLAPEQRVPDTLAELGELAKRPEANIIKLPNISASVPQLKAAIAELRSQGFLVPEYPENAIDDAEKALKARYAKVLGSAVNPVLREGNSDRRVAKAVKKYAKSHPHSMGAWSPDSKSHVSSMDSGDFLANEQAAMVGRAGTLTITHTDLAGKSTVLKEVTVKDRELIAATFLDVAKLKAFYRAQVEDARSRGVLFSLHLKATMMKVSDPILFGHGVEAYYREAFKTHEALFRALGVNPRNGIGDAYAKLASLPPSEAGPVIALLRSIEECQPVAMVDSGKGITNLHVPSDVIIDASMPAAIRTSGCMWNREGALQDTKFVIPDRCYAGVYQAVIDDCKAHGAFDPATLGSVANVGLMAQAAEEYGSHDKTFEIPADGFVTVTDASGTELTRHGVKAGDIWRMCQAKDAAIVDWVGLAVRRTRATGSCAVFWLDPARAYDRLLTSRVEDLLGNNDTDGLDLYTMSPVEATSFTLARSRRGLDTISVTGNVLRDYLTDLFPIMELGTSAKMLSIVPLLAGGGMYETGAGGSAPKHVQQFLEENYLRWDSLGEFLALQVSLEELAARTGNPQAEVLARTLDEANALFLENDKSPARKVGQTDNRGSHFWLTLYWARALARQTGDATLAKRFASLSAELDRNEAVIAGELIAAQGKPVDIGGYYHPDPAACARAMRPSPVFNRILAMLD